MDIGEKVVLLRKKKGYSQEELASQSGVSLRTIQRIEAGKIASGFSMKSVAKALGISTEVLLENINNYTQKEVLNILNKINIFGFLGIFLPFGNFIFPYLYWRKQHRSELLDKVAKRIFNFQLLWTFLASLNFLITPNIQYYLIKSYQIGYGPITWVVFILLLVWNGVMVYRASQSLKKGNFKVFKNSNYLF